MSFAEGDATLVIGPRGRVAVGPCGGDLEFFFTDLPRVSIGAKNEFQTSMRDFCRAVMFKRDAWTMHGMLRLEVAMHLADNGYSQRIVWVISMWRGRKCQQHAHVRFHPTTVDLLQALQQRQPVVVATDVATVRIDGAGVWLERDGAETHYVFHSDVVAPGFLDTTAHAARLGTDAFVAEALAGRDAAFEYGPYDVELMGHRTGLALMRVWSGLWLRWVCVVRQTPASSFVYHASKTHVRDGAAYA